METTIYSQLVNVNSIPRSWRDFFLKGGKTSPGFRSSSNSAALHFALFRIIKILISELSHLLWFSPNSMWASFVYWISKYWNSRVSNERLLLTRIDLYWYGGDKFSIYSKKSGALASRVEATGSGLVIKAVSLSVRSRCLLAVEVMSCSQFDLPLFVWWESRSSWMSTTYPIYSFSLVSRQSFHYWEFSSDFSTSASPKKNAGQSR